MVADVGGKVAGYMIYRLQVSDGIDVLKFECLPAYRDDGIEEQMIATLIGKLQLHPNRWPQIRFNVSDHDMARLELLEKCGFINKGQCKATGAGHCLMAYQWPGTRASGTAKHDGQDEGARDGGDSSADCEKLSPNGKRDGGVAATGDNTAAASTVLPEEPPPRQRFCKMPLPELYRHARKKLTELTLMEWEVVCPAKRGRFVPTEITPGMSDPSDVAFRSCGKVADPNQALAAIREFLGVPVSDLHASVLTKPAQLVIPAAWFRQIHVTTGTPGLLASSCKPADTKARYQPPDEEDQGPSSRSR
jgi:hypothetical protein